jgi:CO/xanthine dehydrogenase FAD-binding subunit
MTSFEYTRPKTIQEAVSLLKRGVPLAGGTRVSTMRRQIETVIDLRDLGLTDLKIEKEGVTIEAGVSLQAILKHDAPLPEGLRSACRLEAAWNIRNAASLGGTIMAEDGRSSLLTVLLALDAQITLEPNSKTMSLESFLPDRAQKPIRQLLTTVHFKLPLYLAYEQVARSPADRPVVAVAVAQFEAQDDEPAAKIALGGFGASPLRAEKAEVRAAKGGSIDSVAEAAASYFDKADDAWASSEYRTAVVEVLVRRLLDNGGA